MSIFKLTTPRSYQTGSADFQAGFIKGKDEVFAQAEAEIITMQARLDILQKQLAQSNEAVHAASKRAVADERKRIRDITGCREAVTHRAAALNLALSTDLPTDQAVKLLALMPEEKTASNAFSDMMATIKNPNIGVSFDDEYNDEDQSNILGILAKGGR